MDSYVDLAKQTIDEYVKNGKTISVPAGLPDEMIKNQAGVFVSIHKKHLMLEVRPPTSKEGELRGCIGTFLPTKNNIAQEIIDNAISACSCDYRFTPVREDELENLEISVDVLGKPEPIEGLSNLDPKKYGVIVKSQTDSRSGLLLPDIPGVDDPAYQVAIAKQKAGILPNEPVYLYRFEVVRHKQLNHDFGIMN